MTSAQSGFDTAVAEIATLGTGSTMLPQLLACATSMWAICDVAWSLCMSSSSTHEARPVAYAIILKALTFVQHATQADATLPLFVFLGVDVRDSHGDCVPSGIECIVRAVGAHIKSDAYVSEPLLMYQATTTSVLQRILQVCRNEAEQAAYSLSEVAARTATPYTPSQRAALMILVCEQIFLGVVVMCLSVCEVNTAVSQVCCELFFSVLYWMQANVVPSGAIRATVQQLAAHVCSTVDAIQRGCEHIHITPFLASQVSSRGALMQELTECAVAQACIAEAVAIVSIRASDHYHTTDIFTAFVSQQASIAEAMFSSDLLPVVFEAMLSQTQQLHVSVSSSTCTCLMHMCLRTVLLCGLQHHLISSAFEPFNVAYPLRSEGIVLLWMTCSLYARLPCGTQELLSPLLLSIIKQSNVVWFERERAWQWKEARLQTSVMHVLQALSLLPQPLIIQLLRAVDVPDSAILAVGVTSSWFSTHAGVPLAEYALPSSFVQAWRTWLARHAHSQPDTLQHNAREPFSASISVLPRPSTGTATAASVLDSIRLQQARTRTTSGIHGAVSVVSRTAATAAVPASVVSSHQALPSVPSCLDVLGERIADVKAAFDAHCGGGTTLSPVALRAAFNQLTLPLMDATRVSALFKRHPKGVAFSLFLQLVTRELLPRPADDTVASTLAQPTVHATRPALPAESLPVSPPMSAHPRELRLARFVKVAAPEPALTASTTVPIKTLPGPLVPHADATPLQPFVLV